MPKADWDYAQSSSDVHPMLGQFFLHFLGSTQSPLLLLPQLLPGCCRLPQKLLLMYAFDPHCLLFHQWFLLRSLQNLHPSLASLLKCSSISSFLNLCSIPKKTSKVPLYLLMYFISVLPAEPFNNTHLKFFSSFLISFRSTPFDRFHFLWCLSFCSSWRLLPPRFTKVPSSASDTIMISGTSASPFGSSLPAATSTQNQFCIRIKRRKSHLPDLTRNCFVLGLLFLSLPFFLQIFFFPFRHKEARKLFFAPCPPKISSVLHFFFLFPLLPFPLLFLSLFLNPPPFNWCFWGSRILSLAVYLVPSHLYFFLPRFLGPYPGCFFLGCLGSFPVCFLQRFLGPFPGCFYFLGAWVPSLSFFFKGSWVLSRAFFISFWFTAPILPHHHPLPHPWKAVLAIWMDLSCLVFLRFRLHQVHSVHKEGQAPNCSLVQLDWPRLAWVTPTADWLCLALVHLHYSFVLLLFLASALVVLPFLFGAFVQRSQFHLLPRRLIAATRPPSSHHLFAMHCYPLLSSPACSPWSSASISASAIMFFFSTLSSLFFPINLFFDFPHFSSCRQAFFLHIFLLSWMLCIFRDLFCTLWRSGMSSFLLFSNSCSWCCSDSTRFSCNSFEAKDNLPTSFNSICIFFPLFIQNSATLGVILDFHAVFPYFFYVLLFKGDTWLLLCSFLLSHSINSCPEALYSRRPGFELFSLPLHSSPRSQETTLLTLLRPPAFSYRTAPTGCYGNIASNAISSTHSTPNRICTSTPFCHRLWLLPPEPFPPWPGPSPMTYSFVSESHHFPSLTRKPF